MHLFRPKFFNQLKKQVIKEAYFFNHLKIETIIKNILQNLHGFNQFI